MFVTMVFTACVWKCLWNHPSVMSKGETLANFSQLLKNKKFMSVAGRVLSLKVSRQPDRATDERE